MGQDRHASSEDSVEREPPLEDHFVVGVPIGLLGGAGEALVHIAPGF
jgi:hypothetical protein